MSLYTEAAQFLDNKGKFGSLKTIIYSYYEKNKSRNDARQVFALVADTLKFKTLLTEIIKKAGIRKQETKLTLPVALLMVHDLLLTKSGRINCGKSATKDAVLKHKTRLKAELVKFKVKNKIIDIESVASGSFSGDETPVRWFRTNTIKATNEEIIKAFDKLHKVDTWQEVSNDRNAIYYDNNVPYLYGINPRFPLTVTDVYKQGKVIIQDRASCFPATMLNPKPGQILIDSCSAPGNKTTHLASFVENTPNSITAFERDPKRAQTLMKMITTAGAEECIDTKVLDFTTCDPQEFVGVTGFVVDPSCSGSGIFGRGFDEEEKTESPSQEELYRLHKLAEFQFKIVSHAMSFPNAQTVVYSTCSIHPQENEQVVRRLLQEPAVQKRGWRMRKADQVLPNWTRRGFPAEFEGMDDPEQLAKSCIRALPKEDGGIGFFAACFERDTTSIEEDSQYDTADKSLEADQPEDDPSNYSDWDGFE